MATQANRPNRNPKQAFGTTPTDQTPLRQEGNVIQQPYGRMAIQWAGYADGVFPPQQLPEQSAKPWQKVGVYAAIDKDITGQPPLKRGMIVKIIHVSQTNLIVDLEDLKGVALDFDAIIKTKDTMLSKIHPVLDLSRVIMPQMHREAISEAVAQLKHNDKIFKDWGFDEVLEKGKAISLLFYGQPGTGKTLCAEMIAKSLSKKLEVIGTGEIQSSEPGQAERNIKAYFENSDSNTILLFDECDSLVHSRNNAGSIMAAQINSLLTALEHYEGIVIFTTNRLGVLDEAFNRRLSLKLEFPMPTVDERMLIWKGMFPTKAPLAKDIKWDKLAALPLTGGYIKNIVLRAARSAAAKEHKTITYATIKKAAQHEVMSKREYEEATKQHRRNAVVTMEQAIQDYSVDISETGNLEVKETGDVDTAGRSA